MSDDSKTARELLDFKPRLPPTQQIGIGLISLATFVFLSPLVSIISSLLVSTLMAWCIRSYLLEAQYQGVMRDASSCGDGDSLFSSVHASELQLPGQESINVHYKAVQSKSGKPVSHSISFLHGFGSNCLSFENIFALLRKDEQISVSAIAHDCPGFGLTERKKGYSFYSLSANGRLASVLGMKGTSSVAKNARLPSSFMLCSDLDGTMVGVDDKGTMEFKCFWDDARSYGSKLVYNTGRSYSSVQELLREKEACLARPDVLICGVGAQIFFPGGNERGWEEDMEWSSRLDEGWGIEKVVSAADRAIATSNSHPSASMLPFTAYFRPKEDQHRHKCSIAVHTSLLSDVLSWINEDLDKAKLRREIIVSHHGELRVLDIIPINGGKKNAMDYVRALWGFAEGSTVAAGDSANDIMMLDGDHKSIAVGNAQPDLMQWLSEKRAKEGKGIYPLLVTSCEARGVLEGLGRLGFKGATGRILVGHSLGAQSASQEAIRIHKEGGQVDALVLIAPAIFARSSMHQLLGRLIKGIFLVVSLALFSLVRLLRPLVILLLRLLVRSKSFWINGLSASYRDPSKLTERTVENYRLPSVVKGWEVGMARFVESRLLPGQPSVDLATELSSLPQSCPVIIVHGRQDRIVPLSNSILLAKALNCRLEVIEDCGHSPQEETPSALHMILSSLVRQNKQTL